MKPFDLDQELRKTGKEKLAAGVPDMIRQRQDEVYASLADLPMHTRTGRKQRSGRVRTFAIGAAAAAFIGVMSSAYVSPIMAESLKKVPLIGSIFQMVNDLGLQTAEERGLVTPLSVSAEQEGITLSIPEVVYDGTRLSMAVKREGEGLEGGILEHTAIQEGNTSKDIYPRGAITRVEMQIDGTSIDDYDLGARPGLSGKPTSDPNGALFELLNMSLDETGIRMPDEFQLTVNITLEGIAKPFVMEIPVRKSTDQIILPLKETREWNGIQLTLEQLKFTPITTGILMNIEQTNPDKALSDETLLFEVWDEKGRVLETVGGLGIYSEDNHRQEREELLFDRFAEAPRAITLKVFKPELVDPSQKSGAFKTDENGDLLKTYLDELEITIPVDQAGLKQLYDDRQQ